DDTLKAAGEVAVNTDVAFDTPVKRLVHVVAIAAELKAEQVVLGVGFQIAVDGGIAGVTNPGEFFFFRQAAQTNKNRLGAARLYVLRPETVGAHYHLIAAGAIAYAVVQLQALQVGAISSGIGADGASGIVETGH